MLAIKAVDLSQQGKTGIILCCREYMISLADSSFAEIKTAIIESGFLEPYFEIGNNYIRTTDGKISFVFCGLRHNLDSVKSKARIFYCWIDEAENTSETAYEVLIPTIREEKSELWISYNPASPQSATHKRFRENTPDDCITISMNFSDNPFFPDVLNKTRLEDLKNRPESYGHIWLGEFRENIEGAYYTKQLLEAKQQGRICNLSKDPLTTIKVFCDIGGTSSKSDSFVLIPVQFINKEIRILDHYEAVGQDFNAHLLWLKDKNYTPNKAEIYLPHDGKKQDFVFDASYESAFKAQGYKVTIIPNQGKGAALQRIDAVRRLFPDMWFNEPTTNNLITMLSNYREKKNQFGIGVGALHDEASNSADALGYMAISYKPPTNNNFYKPLSYPSLGY
jgi:phage terminase large subunit